MKSESPNETWTEEEIFQLTNRIASLEEINRRIKKESLMDDRKAIEVLLDVAKGWGGSNPESWQIADSLTLLINKNDKNFNQVLDGLTVKNGNLFFCYSRVVPHLNQEKKKRSIYPLVLFLMSGVDINESGAKEVYNILTTIDDEEINRYILKLISPHLVSLNKRTVYFAVRIASNIGDDTLTEQMLEIFRKSFKGYYDDIRRSIQKELCIFLKKLPDKRSLPFIINMLEYDRTDTILEAIASVVDAFPEVLEEIYQTMAESENSQYFVWALAKTNTAPISFEKIINLTPKHLLKSNLLFPLKDLAFRIGDSAKQYLLELARSKEPSEHEFAISCLDEIGVSFDEITKVFDKNPILQVYDFFFENKKDLLLDDLWCNQRRLREQIPGKWDKFEHLIQNLFTAFGYLVIYVDPSGREGVDLVAFSPDTFQCCIIGCTTGVLKDDILKLRATLVDMEDGLEGFFTTYEITPVNFSSIEIGIPYSEAQEIAVLTPENIQKLIEMLKLNRTRKDVNDFLMSCMHYETYGAGQVSW